MCKDIEQRMEQLVQQAMSRFEGQAAAQGMDQARIIARRGAVAGCRFHVLEGVDRLMPLAARAIMELDDRGRDLASGTVWWASSLGAPRGRMQRQWWAPEGGIYFCIAIFPELQRVLWPLYSIAMGVAIADVMQARGVDARVRWINDVLLNGRKVSGTIAETVHAPMADQTYLVMGTGINVNIPSFPDYLGHATSLLLETGKRWDLPVMGAEIIARLGWYMGLLHQWDAENLDREPHERSESTVISVWRQRSDSLGRQVVFGRDLESEEGERGDILDIEVDGRLVIQDRQGEIIMLDSGEIRYV